MFLWDVFRKMKKEMKGEKWKKEIDGGEKEKKEEKKKEGGEDECRDMDNEEKKGEDGGKNIEKKLRNEGKMWRSMWIRREKED